MVRDKTPTQGKKTIPAVKTGIDVANIKAVNINRTEINN
jgi:hypothetical protein